MSKRCRDADQTGPAALPPEVAAKVARRAKLAADLEAARAQARAKGEGTTAALTTGSNAANVERLLDEQARAEQRVAALVAAVDTLDKEIPEARHAAGRGAAVAVAAAAPAQHAALVATIMAAQAKEREQAAALTVTMKDEEAARMDDKRLRAGLRLVAARFDGLGIPALPLLPPRDDVLVEALRVAARDPAGPPPLTVPHSASATPEQVQRATWQALATYLDRHAGSLPEAVRAVFALAGVPAWETDQQRERHETLEREKAEAERRFTGAAATEAARSAVRSAL